METNLNRFHIIQMRLWLSFIENNLTMQQYIHIRLSTEKWNAHIYPPYNTIIAAKKQFYSKNCTIYKSYCEINSQDLSNHTSQRIFLISGKKERTIL